MMNKIFAHLSRKKIIREQAIRNNEIMRGARAMNKQLAYGFLERGTSDFDLFSKTPRKSALELERELDKLSGGDFYYVKPAKHKGTFRVMDKGNDLESEHDDIVIADYTKQPKKVKIIDIGGLSHVHISERIKDIKTTLLNPEAAHRHFKDRSDLERIKISKTFRRRF